LQGVEHKDALLSNAGLAFRLMGYPNVALDQIVEWVAEWVVDGGATLDKPTEYGVRDGRF
jgi:hypothetical protein